MITIINSLKHPYKKNIYIYCAVGVIIVVIYIINIFTYNHIIQRNNLGLARAVFVSPSACLYNFLMISFLVIVLFKYKKRIPQSLLIMPPIMMLLLIGDMLLLILYSGDCMKCQLSHSGYNIAIKVVDVLHTLLIMLQLRAWLCLAFLDNDNWDNLKYFYVGTIVLNFVVLFYAYIDVYSAKHLLFSFSGCMDFIKSVIYIAIFSVTLFCYSKSKNVSFIFAPIVACVICCVYILSKTITVGPTHVLLYYPLCCLTGGIITIIGLLFFIKRYNAPYPFHRNNSLPVFISAIVSFFTGIILIFIISIHYVIFKVYARSSNEFILFMKSLPCATWASYLTMMNIAKLVSESSKKQLFKITKRISMIKSNQKYNGETPEKSNIYEVARINNTIKEMHIKARSFSLAKEKFIENMSTNYRPALQAILSLTSRVKHRLSDSRSKFMQGLIVDSYKQIIDMIDSLYDYSKTGHKSYPLKIDDCEIMDILHNVILLMRPYAVKKGLVLSLKSENSKITFPTNYLTLKKILINLITNALKYTHQGTISVFVSSNEHKKLTITVKDTGIGVHKEHVADIFKPFFRIRHSGYESHGIGLGLSTVKNLLNKLNGSIYLDSSISGGSTFVVTLNDL